MKISVTICTYNGEKYLESQLESIVNQSRKPDQIVISDDNSKDSTWSIIMQWKQKYPLLIECYRQDKNLGLNKNFDFVLSKATGDYIAISDQDDIWYANKLETLEKQSNRYPDVMLFHHSEDTLGQTETKNSLPFWKAYEGKGLGIIFIFNRLTGHVLFFKKDLLSKILPIPDDIYYDWWINANVAVAGKTKYVQDKLMAYRKHDESVYFSDVEKQWENVTPGVRIAINRFLKIDYLNEIDQLIGNKLSILYQKHSPNKFDWNLFCFLYKNKKELFKDLVIPGSAIYRHTYIIRKCRLFAKW